MTTLRTLALLLLAPALAPAPLPAGDWPHWLGPTRDNVWRADGLLDKFPAGGPRVVWRSPVAGGYAGPAVAGGKVFCSEYRGPATLGEGNFDRKEAAGEETVFALDAATGKRLWEQKYPVKYTISYPAGPRCTPTVDGNVVYFLGAEGNLLACDTADGKVVWRKDLKAAYKTKSALWGYAAHPLIDGDKLITLAGGDGSHVVALNKKTGEEIWRAESSPEQGYVPPTIVTAGGVRQLLLAGPKAVKGLDPETGKRLWSTPYDADSGSIIMSPVVADGYLFIGGFNNKNLLLRLTADRPGVEVVARDVPKKFLSAVNAQPYAEGDVIYGIDASGLMVAVELPTGKRLWESDAFLTEGKARVNGTAFPVRNGGRVWLFNELGELVLATVNKTGYAEIDRVKLLEPTGKAFGRKVAWCHPAFAGTRMYVRNDKELICVELAK